MLMFPHSPELSTSLMRNLLQSDASIRAARILTFQPMKTLQVVEDFTITLPVKFHIYLPWGQHQFSIVS